MTKWKNILKNVSGEILQGKNLGMFSWKKGQTKKKLRRVFLIKYSAKKFQTSFFKEKNEKF